MEIIFLENSINAFFLNAFSAATCTVLPEFNCGILSDGMKPRWCSFYWNVILFGHAILRTILNI
jgi:hypothetical protein